jgi:hypothetical protein
MVQLLRLFRHSSFVWRIRGEHDREELYARRLRDDKVEDAVKAPGRSSMLEMVYFLRRLKTLIVDALLPKPDAPSET